MGIDLLDLFCVVFACLAVVATALAQIFTNTYQKSLDCNALQLLYHTSPYIALVSAFCRLILDVVLTVTDGCHDIGNVDHVPHVR